MVIVVLAIFIIFMTSFADSTTVKYDKDSYCRGLYVYQELGYTRDRYPFGDTTCTSWLDSTSMAMIRGTIDSINEGELMRLYPVLISLIKNRNSLLSGSLSSNGWKTWPSVFREQYTSQITLPWMNEIDGFALYWSRKGFRMKDYMQVGDSDFESYVVQRVNTKMWCRDVSTIVRRIRTLNPENIYVKSFESICVNE